MVMEYKVTDALDKMEGPDPTGYRPKGRFVQLAQKNSVLNFSSHLQRENYANSPIAKYLEDLRQLRHEGRVHVAFVPRGKGKTTACQAFFKGGPTDKIPLGIAICPARTTMPYVFAMMGALGLDTARPPSGWLPCLFEALQTSASGEQTFLLLDDFMSSGPDKFDARLLKAIEAGIRHSRITVVVLSQSREAASFMLTLNDLVGIVPIKQCLTDNTWFERTRLNFSEEACLAAPWTDVPWSDREMEEAVVVYPQLRGAPGGECVLRQSIQKQMGTFEEGPARAQLTPGALLDLLVSDQARAGNERLYEDDQIPIVQEELPIVQEAFPIAQEETGCFFPYFGKFKRGLSAFFGGNRQKILTTGKLHSTKCV
jgi:hypothetical protein